MRNTRNERRMAVALVAAIFAVAAGGRPAAAQVRIVTTTPDMAALARHAGGSLIEVSSLTGGRQNLHAIQAKPSYMMLARRADLWIRVGLDLEIGYERPILQGARNRDIMAGRRGYLDASEGIEPLEVPGSGLAAAVGLSYGDVHPKGNPHYWLDPFNARIVTGTIATRLAELDPANAAAYEANRAAFAEQIDRRMFGEALVEAAGADELWAMSSAGELAAYLEANPEPAAGGWTAAMAPLRGQQLITYHRSWVYFTKRFGIEAAEHVEPRPGIPPSPRHVARVIQVIKDNGIQIILMEPFYSSKAPETIARQTGAGVVVAALSVTGQPGVEDYFDLIDNLVGRLAAAFSSR